MNILRSALGDLLETRPSGKSTQNCAEGIARALTEAALRGNIQAAELIVRMMEWPEEDDDDDDLREGAALRVAPQPPPP